MAAPGIHAVIGPESVSHLQGRRTVPTRREGRIPTPSDPPPLFRGGPTTPEMPTPPTICGLMKGGFEKAIPEGLAPHTSHYPKG